MKLKRTTAAVIFAAGLLLGCENDDSPMRAGNCTITVANSTRSVIHVEYRTQTWDLLVPGIDESHVASKDIGPGRDADLSVHFGSELGTSGIEVTKDGLRKKYDVEFGRQTLTVREEHFTGE